MNPPPLWQMLLLVAGTYLATYGPGRLLVHALGLKVASFQERLGISCAVGAVVLGWLGYVAVMAGVPWLAIGGGWLALALGLVMIVRGVTWAKETCDLTNANRTILGLAILIGLGFAAGMNYWQIAYHADGSMGGRFVWPDLLYRNAVLGRLLACDGPPDWPWLAGLPLKGMSLLRFTALVPIFKALAVPATHYQIAALWLGLFGVPVAACAALALFRAFGATQRVGVLAVLLTSFVGNPRWLLNERFAHSPALHWAGTDVFAIAVPVLFAMLALIVLAIRCRAQADGTSAACTPPTGPSAANGMGGVQAPALQNGTAQSGALWLAALFLVSGMGFVPYEGLAVYVAVPLWLVFIAFGDRSYRRKAIGMAAALTAAAALGVVVLKVLMGSGTAHGSPLAALGPSPTIRNLSWAFPFLSEPLTPLLAHLGPTALLKLLKFGVVYPVAVGFYLWGSMWVRNVLLPHGYRFPWRRLREPDWAFGLCLVIGGVLLSSVVDFNKLAYQNAQYDVYRVLWPALLLANLGCALLLVDYGPRLRRGLPLLILVVLVCYGAWENSQLVLWSRTALPRTTVAADDMAALRYLGEHARGRDVLFVDPRHAAPPDVMGHNWGYVSGLLPVRVYLDNGDMAHKFGQGPVWDLRLAEAQQAMRGAPEGFAAFLQRNGITWVMAQDEGLSRLCDTAGLTEAFRKGGVVVFRSGSAESGGTIRIQTAEQDPTKRTTLQQGVTADELGLAYYPGATVNKSELQSDAKGRVGGAELQTMAAYADVVKFYRERYQPWRPVIRTRDDRDGPTTMLNWQDRHGNYTIVIKRDNAAHCTRVTLARTGAQVPGKR